jgi:hypothetical protein
VRFRAEIHVWTDEGDACGQAHLEFDGGSLAISIYHVEGISELAELGIVRGRSAYCPERGGDCENGEFTIQLPQDPNDDEPIWQFHLGGSHPPAFPAHTRIVLPGRGGDDDGVR